MILLLISINYTTQHGGVPKHLKLKPFGHHQVSMNEGKSTALNIGLIYLSITLKHQTRVLVVYVYIKEQLLTLFFFYCNKTKKSYLILLYMHLHFWRLIWSCTQISKLFSSALDPYYDIPLRLVLVHILVTIVAWFQQVLRQAVDFPERSWRWFGRGYILWNLFSDKFLVVIVFFSMYL